MENITLEGRQLYFYYQKNKHILENVSVELQKGEWLTLLGPNGAGKTTLLRLLLQQLPPIRGEIKIAGKLMKSLSAQERAALIAYVPQMTRIPFDLTVWEVVLTGRVAFSPYSYKREDYAIVEQLIEKLHLQHLAFSSVNKLSGGERQRVFIARALAQGASILCMDEPTTGMDPEHQLLTLELVRKMVDNQEIGLIMTLHDLNLAGMFSDRIAMLSKHRLVACGTPREVLTEQMIRDIYHVSSEVEVKPDGVMVKIMR